MTETIIPEEARLFRWAAIETEVMNPLLTRQYASGKQGMVARIMLQKGCVVAEHSHPNEQIAMIVSGALEFVVGDETFVVRAGEMLIIPAGVPHSAVALEDTEDIDFFAPPRQDWIDKSDDYLRQAQDSK